MPPIEPLRPVSWLFGGGDGGVMWTPDQLDAAWRRLVGSARRATPELLPEARVSAWAESVRSIRALFAAHVGEKAVSDRLEIPVDYAAFMERVGGGWVWRQGLEQSLFTADSVADGTANDFRLFVTERDEDDGPQDDGLWVRIGRYSDKHETLLCCDRTHRLHGRVVDGHDDHPWLNGLSSPFCQVAGQSFTEWLEYAAKHAEPAAADVTSTRAERGGVKLQQEVEPHRTKRPPPRSPGRDSEPGAGGVKGNIQPDGPPKPGPPVS